MLIRRHVAVVAIAALCSLVASGCSGADSTDENGTSSASCAVRVQFQGRAYVEAPKDVTGERGDKIGEGRNLGCAGSDVLGPSSKIAIYEVVGRSASKTVMAESPGGSLLLEPAAEE